MFDSIRVSQASAYPQTIHQHNAPTQESVRLLREMEEAVEKNVLARGVSAPDNGVSFRWVFRSNPVEDEYVLSADGTINGREFRVQEAIRDWEFRSWRDPEARQSGLQKMVKSLTDQVIAVMVERSLAESERVAQELIRTFKSL